MLNIADHPALALPFFCRLQLQMYMWSSISSLRLLNAHAVPLPMSSHTAGFPRYRVLGAIPLRESGVQFALIEYFYGPGVIRSFLMGHRDPSPKVGAISFSLTNPFSATKNSKATGCDSWPHEGSQLLFDYESHSGRLLVTWS